MKGVPKTARQWCLVLDLTEVGASVAEASEFSHISIPAIYAKMKHDPDFAAAFARARELAPPDSRPRTQPKPKPAATSVEEFAERIAEIVADKIVEELRRVES